MQGPIRNTNSVITLRYVGNMSQEGTRENIEVMAPVGHSMNSTFTLSNKSITWKKSKKRSKRVKKGQKEVEKRSKRGRKEVENLSIIAELITVTVVTFCVKSENDHGQELRGKVNKYIFLRIFLTS